MAKFILSAFADEAGSSLEEQIAALKENGIGYIEPRNIGGKGILDLSDEELLITRLAFDKAGIRVGSLGSPIGKVDIHEDFAPHFEKFRHALKVCKTLGTDKMRMFSFFVPQNELAEQRAEVISRLKLMVAEAEAAGITLCHENESKIYGQMPAEVFDILSSVRGLYGIFDAANYRMNGADPIEGIRATMVRFGYMHVKDAIYESHWVVPAGEGEGRISEVLDTIAASTDGQVMLTLEPHLHVFDAYKNIDSHELRGKYVFNTRREAFDYAAKALKALLRKKGYERNGNNEWIKK